MKIVIIEDEIHTAWELKHMLERLCPDYSFVQVIDSVRSGLEWFGDNPCPDLIFSDIRLGDGLSFEIFTTVDIDCPVIFCTAYDQYAIRAFQNNGIDYILKPVNELSLQKSIAKINLLMKRAEKRNEREMIDKLWAILEAKTIDYKQTFLVSFRDKTIPLQTQEIAYFHYVERNVLIYSRQQQAFLTSSTLDYLETVLDPQLFYRANRQFIIARSAVREIEHEADRKLQVHLLPSSSEAVIVSKAKAGHFLKWLERSHS